MVAHTKLPHHSFPTLFRFLTFTKNFLVAAKQSSQLLDISQTGFPDRYKFRYTRLTWEGGRAGITKNVTHAGSQMTWEGGNQKRYTRGVTTDLLDV